MKKLLFLLIISLTISSQASALFVTIYGEVMNKYTNELIANHSIMVVDLSSPYDTTYISTNQNGSYTFTQETGSPTVFRIITEGYDNGEISYSQADIFPTSITPIEQNFEIYHQPNRTFTFSGQVIIENTNEPAVNLPVNIITDLQNNEFITIYTNEHGQYSYSYSIPYNATNKNYISLKGFCGNNWVEHFDSVSLSKPAYEKDFLICHDPLWYLEDFIVEGAVYDSITGEPVPNHPVYIIRNSDAENFLKIYTNTEGFFSDTMKIKPNSPNIFNVRTYGYCENKAVVHYNQVVTGYSGSYFQEFYICTKNEPPNNDECEISFFYYANDENLKINFFWVSDSEIDSIFWDFGDEQIFKTRANPHHTYSEEGLYQVCLTAYTQSGCVTTYCSKVSVGNSFQLAGKVYASDAELPVGKVAVFEYNSKIDTYTHKQDATVNSGEYKIEKMFEGEYLLLAIPEFDVGYNFFPKYLPTYYPNSTEWQTASPQNLSETNNNFDIHLVKYEEIFYGNYTISGSVNPNGEADADKITVILSNSQNVPIDFRVLDENYNFEFCDLPEGNYNLRAEYAGKISQICNFNLSEQNTHQSVDFTVTQTEITFYFVNIPTVENNAKYTIYPNPFSDYLTIESPDLQNINLKILDNNGKIVFEKININQTAFSEDFSRLPNGTYFIQISNENEILQQSQIVKMNNR